MVSDEQYEEAFRSMNAYYKEIYDHNAEFIKQFGETHDKDFADLIEGCTVTDKIQFVEKQMGREQFEDDCGVFTNVHVDQWNSGITGDSYGGVIYANVFGRWIAIPYEC